MLDELPMPDKQAEAFVRSRTNPYGSVNRDVVLDLTVESAGFDHFVGIMPNAEVVIVDMRVYPDEHSNTPLASLEPTLKAAFAAARQARAAAAAEDAANIRPFNKALYADDVRALQDGRALADPRPIRWTAGFNLASQRPLQLPSLEPIMIRDMIPNPGHAPTYRNLKFINIDEINAAKLPEAAAAEIAKGQKQTRINFIYRLVGYLNDPELHAQSVLAHADAIEIEVFDADGSKRFRTDLTSKAQPVSLKVDERKAADFEVAGVRLRQPADSVKSALEKAFGDPLVYDAAHGVLHSANPVCAANADIPVAQLTAYPRCVVGYFATVGHTFFGSDIRGLVRLEISQGFDQNAFDRFTKGLRSQFGDPRDSHGEFGGWFEMWGQRLAERPINAPAPTPFAPMPLSTELLGDPGVGQHVVQLEVLTRETYRLTRFHLDGSDLHPSADRQQVRRPIAARWSPASRYGAILTQVTEGR